MDESPKQLIKETHMPLKRKLGSDERADYEYERCGVANIFMVNEPLWGKRYVKITERKTKKDWAWLIKEIADEHYPFIEKISWLWIISIRISLLLFTKHFHPVKKKGYGTGMNLYILQNMEVD